MSVLPGVPLFTVWPAVRRRPEPAGWPAGRYHRGAAPAAAHRWSGTGGLRTGQLWWLGSARCVSEQRALGLPRYGRIRFHGSPVGPGCCPGRRCCCTPRSCAGTSQSTPSREHAPRTNVPAHKTFGRAARAARQNSCGGRWRTRTGRSG